jgi:hypothetical protein
MSVRGNGPRKPGRRFATEMSQRVRNVFWLPASAFLLLIGAGLLAFTSPSRDAAPSTRKIAAGRPPQRADSETRPEMAAEPELEEPQREPWWLIGVTFTLVLVTGLLLIFYAQIPISALI